MKEIRILVADLSSWYTSDDSLEQVWDCAESQGTVYSLYGFVQAQMEGELDLTGDQTVMKAIVVENGNLVEEITSNEWGF